MKKILIDIVSAVYDRTLFPSSRKYARSQTAPASAFLHVLQIAFYATLVSCFIPIAASAQGRGAPAATAKAAAPADLTGYWVAFVTEDWRFRMVTPEKATIKAFR